MREELIFPQVDLQNLNKVIELIDSIAENSGDCGALLEQLSGLTGKTHDAMELLHRSLALPNVMDIIMSERDVTKAAEKIACAAKSSVICL